MPNDGRVSPSGSSDPGPTRSGSLRRRDEPNSATSIEPSRAFAQTRTLTRPRRFALQTSEWKLVLNPDDEEEELFDLRADPGETTDVSNDHPDGARGFRDEIEFISSGDDGDEAGVDDLDPAAIEHLKALGYIDG